MKRSMIAVAPVACLLCTAAAVFALTGNDIPGRTGRWVNDYARVIDRDTRKYIQERVSSIKQKTPDPVEVIISTFRTMEGWNMHDFMRAYGEKWREIKKGKRDNGVIIIVDVKEGRAMIGVGQNLGSVLTGKETARILNDIIAPRISKGEYSLGLKEGVDAIITVIERGAIPMSPAVMVIRIVLLALGCIFIVRIIRHYRKK